MEFLTEKQKEKELERIKAVLVEKQFEAEILPKGQLLDQTVLLIGLPSEEDPVVGEDGIPENLHVAVGTVLHLGDAPADAQTKYLMLLALIPADLEGIGELEIYRLVNEMNQTVRMGNFCYGDFSRMGDGIVIPFRYQLVLGASTDGFWDETVLEDALIETSMYYDMMIEEVRKLKE